MLPADQVVHYGTHSCDPNTWWIGPYVLAARRDIRAGEELTNDHPTSTGEESFTMRCSCGSPLCRGTVTGGDWRRGDLRHRYGDHKVPALVERISGLKEGRRRPEIAIEASVDLAATGRTSTGKNPSSPAHDATQDPSARSRHHLPAEMPGPPPL